MQRPACPASPGRGESAGEGLRAWGRQPDRKNREMDVGRVGKEDRRRLPCGPGWAWRWERPWPQEADRRPGVLKLRAGDPLSLAQTLKWAGWGRVITLWISESCKPPGDSEMKLGWWEMTPLIEKRKKERRSLPLHLRLGKCPSWYWSKTGGRVSPCGPERAWPSFPPGPIESLSPTTCLKLLHCHSRLYGFVKKWGVAAQSCPPLCNPLDYSPAGSSVCGISQTRILEWVAIPFSMGSSQPRDGTRVSCVASRLFYPLSHQGSFVSVT